MEVDITDINTVIKRKRGLLIYHYFDAKTISPIGQNLGASIHCKSYMKINNTHNMALHRDAFSLASLAARALVSFVVRHKRDQKW